MRKLKALRKIIAQLGGKFVLAWTCPAPPDLEAWQRTTDEDLSEYFSIIDYLDEHAENVEPQELFDAVEGGYDQVVEDLGYDVYDEYLKMQDDQHISWYKSHYPDGTPVYYHTYSGIEYVYAPVGYDRPELD